MQIKQSFFSILLVLLLLFGICSPLTFSFAVQEVYDYGQFTDKINTSSQKIIEKDLNFASSRTSFSLVFPDYSPTADDDVQVEWTIDGKKFDRILDIDDATDISVISTFPFVTHPTQDIHLKVTFQKEIPSDFLVISSSEAPKGKKLSFSPGSFITFADSGPHIITRAEWGADESLRYLSPSYVTKKKADWVARGQTPRVITETQAAHDARLKESNQFSAINAMDPDARNTVSIQRFEGIHKLFWPIEKVKKVSKIVIHHTAESLDQDATDDVLIRAIYSYHAQTRAWGDIGYNYIIGQRGQVYEGRVGGDYVEGAHVYGDNAGTVGISVIGNYDVLHLNRDQEKGLLDTITWLAQKYGIDVNADSVGAKVCGKGENCIWKAITTPSLIGHRDLGTTDCPGNNIYDRLAEFRATVSARVGAVSPIYNPGPYKIDPIEPEDMVTYQIIEPPVTQKPLIPIAWTDSQVFTPTTSFGGKSIQIKLSYPSSSITLAPATLKKPNARAGVKIVPFTSKDSANITLDGNENLKISIGNQSYIAKMFSLSSDVLRISSWSRLPDWDTSKKYNDNLFRGKITLRNQNGKLLVVNELPLEDYLRGIGEVSNTDLPEKIKTIIVAARSYASFYMNPQNRKFSTILYDGSDNPDEFQKYLGYSYELRSPNTSKAVQDTNSEVIKYAGQVVKAWYFSSSDGKTRSYLEYCQTNGGKDCKDIPYLQSVSDPAGVGKTRSGHGVGISGIGATYAASLGKTYKEIIQYYMKGVRVLKN